jgi:hypothetical protein
MLRGSGILQKVEQLGEGRLALMLSVVLGSQRLQRCCMRYVTQHSAKINML